MQRSILRQIVRKTGNSDSTVAAGTGAIMEFVLGVIRQDMTPEKFNRWWKRFLMFLEVDHLEGEILDAIREKDRQQE